jgi:hypothetical protein
MASYLDKAPTFNPYVSQLPVEAMVKVGMQKQQQYDEGLEKIQSSIDNVSGLDIANDADKQYLQTKMGELGNKLQGVAAGDFSNAQLVNSVTGMTNNLVKDRNIQTALMSTSQLRKEQQKKEQAIKSGKSSIENEWIFGLQVNDYLSNTKPGQVFNGQYIEYTDVDKQLRDLASKLKEVDSSVDNPYIRNEEGKTLYYDNKGNTSLDSTKGSPKFDMVMLTTKIKGVGANKILENFMGSLDENAKRQLNITAQYHYRDANYETFQKEIIETYAEKKKIYSEALIEASVQLNSKKLNPKEKEKLEIEINKAKVLVYEGGFDKEMAEELQKMDTEAEADDYKYKIYTQKYLTKLAKNISNENLSTEYKTNPGRVAILEEKKYLLDVQKEIRSQEEWDADYTLKLREDARKQQEHDNKTVGNLPIVKDSKIETDITKLTLDSLIAETTVIKSEKSNKELSLGKVLIPDNSINLSGLTKEQKTKKLEELKSSQIKAAQVLLDEYTLNPGSQKDGRLVESLEELRQLNEQLLDKTVFAASIKKLGEPYDNEIKQITSKENGIRLGNTSFSANELVDFRNSVYKNVKTIEGMPDDRGRKSYDLNISKNFLETYKGTKNYPIALAWYNDINNLPMSDGQKTIVRQTNTIQSNVGGKVSKLFKERNKIQQEEILIRKPEIQSKDITLNPTNTFDMTRADQILTQKLKDYNDYGSLDKDNKEDFFPETVEKIRTSANKGFTIIKNYDGSAQLVLTAGELTQKVPLTKSEFNSWYPSYSAISPMTSIKEKINSSESKTTNSFDKISGAGARFSGHSNLLPLLNYSDIASNVRVDIEGSFNNSGGPSDRFRIRVYHNLNGDWEDKIFGEGELKTENETQALLSQIGPGSVKLLFNTK